MNILTTKMGDAPAPAKAFDDLDGKAGAESEPVIRRFMRVFNRWRWVILGAVTACILLGMVVTLLMTPKFTASTTLEISRESDKITDFQGVERETTVGDQEFYQTQFGLLQARTLAERVATQLRLVDDPQFYEMFGGIPDKPAFELSGDRFAAAGRSDRLRKAGAILLENVSINPTRLSRLVDISFTSPDAAFSAKVSSAWAENFIQTNLERKVQATSYGRDALQKQLVDYKDRLDQSQRQMVTYAAEQQIINLPVPGAANGDSTAERSIVADNLAALNLELNKAIAGRVEAEARFRQAGRGGATGDALSNIAINGLRERRAELAAEYQQLMVRFEPGYPQAMALQSQIQQLDRSIAAEESRVSRTLESAYREATQRESAMLAKVSQLKGEYLDNQRRSIQYNIYQQEVDTNRALYDGLLQRFKEIGVAGGVGVNNIAIVDPADTPQRPSSPRMLINLLLSLFAGLGLGAALALILEQMDDAVTDPTDLERKLGLPLLGSVPVVEDGNPKEALADRKSEIVEAYFAVQTNLAFTTEHGVPRSFAVTSTRPAEGKSTTSLALATTLARGNRKVILVDGDMRSPSVHQFAGVGHERGLSNLLAGDDSFDGMIFEMPALGFDAMSAGPIPPNAAELLTGLRLPQLIDRLLETYDHVIIDSPPIMGLADAPLIASRVEGVIYVVESHGIRSGMVKTALNRLRTARVRIFGGVLTKFESKRAQYGYEYGYSYGRE